VHLVLASSSARRQQLLSEYGYAFEVVAPQLEEPDETFHGLKPSQQAEALAYFKARAVADRFPEQYVLGADTIVALGPRILGKPADPQEARAMLESLSGTRHRVITGMALLAPGGRRVIASDVTYVSMRKMSDDEIEQYIRSNEWNGKAGAYAIQETADRFVQEIQGSFTNIVGLPMELLARMLKKIA
jgi:septum formation protein